MKKLLTLAAVIEAATGLALMACRLPVILRRQEMHSNSQFLTSAPLLSCEVSYNT